MPDQQDIDIGAFLGNSPKISVEGSQDKESGEAKELDTSEEEPEEESDEENGEGEGEESEEESESSDKDYQSLYNDTEQKRISQQSRADRAENEKQAMEKQLAEFQNQLNELKSQQEKDQIGEVFDGKDEDDFITISDAKKLYKPTKRQQVVQSPAVEPVETWMQKQPDYAIVNDYYTSNKDDVDMWMKASGMEGKDIYRALSDKVKYDQIESLQKQISSLTKGSKKKVRTPLTGSGGSPAGRTSKKKGSPAFDYFNSDAFFRG